MNINEKMCSKCQLIKSVDSFWKSIDGNKGRHSYCKECAKKDKSLRHRANPETTNAKRREKYATDEVYRALQSQKAQEYYDNAKQDEEKRLRRNARTQHLRRLRLETEPGYRESENARERERRKNPGVKAVQLQKINEKYQNDINFRLKTILRSRVYTAIMGENKSKSTMELIGCDIDFLKQRLESLFQQGMSWDNYGKEDGKWHIDHIIPCAFFKFENSEEQELCFHYTNLQPLWAKKNWSKNAKLL